MMLYNVPGTHSISRCVCYFFLLGLLSDLGGPGLTEMETSKKTNLSRPETSSRLLFVPGELKSKGFLEAALYLYLDECCLFLDEVGFLSLCTAVLAKE